MSFCSRCAKEVLPGRRSFMAWVFAGTCAGAGLGALTGVGLALVYVLGNPISLSTASLLPVLTLYGALVGGPLGLLGGLVMTPFDRWLDQPASREMSAAVLGLGIGCLAVFYYPPVMLVTGPLGFLAGWAAAALVTFIRRG